MSIGDNKQGDCNQYGFPRRLHNFLVEGLVLYLPVQAGRQCRISVVQFEDEHEGDDEEEPPFNPQSKCPRRGRLGSIDGRAGLPCDCPPRLGLEPDASRRRVQRP